jgi:aminopeptidase Y
MEDFADFTPGNIALLQRGTCSDTVKAQNAQEAGASAVIIFNEGQPERSDLYFTILGFFIADFEVNIPVIGTTFALGEALANTPGAIVHVFTETLTERRETVNVFAETRTGNPEKVVMAGAHLDSVSAGPGINDNGSGSASLLEVAEQMAKVKPRNKLRFAWWGAEEEGLLGSLYYVFNLSEEQLSKISLYLNFDMVASPNYVFFVYDGDDSDAMGAGPGPSGSAHIEQTFEKYYERVGELTKGTDFDGRSDYLPFIIFDIPAGGIFTGAEGIKTPEEAAIWGGTAGEPYDPCYHQSCDIYENINDHALEINADAIAYAVLTYSKSVSDLHDGDDLNDFSVLEASKLIPHWQLRSIRE